MKNESPLERVLIFLFLGMFGVSLGLAFGAQIASLVHCQSNLVDMSPSRGMAFLSQGSDAFVPDANGCVPSHGQVWLWILILTSILIAAVVTGFNLWRNWKQSAKHLVKDIKRRDGIAQTREIKEIAGAKPAIALAKEIRPSLSCEKKIKPTDAGWKVGTAWSLGVYVTAEDSVILIGPPRSGKGFFLVINLILDAPGAVITTSTRGDNYRATYELRKREGRPVVLFDPQGLSKMPATLKWSPMQGCEDPQVAMRRAKVLVAASGSGGSGNNQEWAQISETILAYLLHAGALGGISTHELGRWGASAKVAEEAISILQQSPRATPGWALGLENELKSDPRMLPSKWMGVGNALQSLMLPQVTEALNPSGAHEMLNPKEFIEQRGTLYLIGTKSGGGAIAPYLIALMDEMVETARELAFRSPSNRLDPPLSLILDEIANLAVWPGLPQVMADGGGVGISTWVVLQSLAQARAGWGEQEAQAIFDAAIVKIQLGGAGNPQDLAAFEELAGSRMIREKTKSWQSDGGSSTSEQHRKDNVLEKSEMRRLPKGVGLYFGRNGRPFLVDMVRWIDRKDAPLIRQSIKSFDTTLASELESELNRREKKQLVPAEDSAAVPAK